MIRLPLPSLRRALRLSLTGALAAGLAAGVLAAPAPAQAANRTTPGNFTGYGFDQCLAPTQRSDGRVAGQLPVLGGGHLHLRQLPGVPQPAQPHPDLDRHPADEGVAAAADRSRPAGLVPAAVPALPRRPDDQPQARQERQLLPGPQEGWAEADKTAADAAALGIAPRQHAVVRPRGLRPLQHPLSRVRTGLHSAPGSSSSASTTTSPASTPAPGRASRCSTTPASTGPGSSTCRTGSGSPAGTARPTSPRPTSATTAGCPATG